MKTPCDHPHFQNIEGHGYVLEDDGMIRLIWTMCGRCHEIVGVRLDKPKEKLTKPHYL